jgi:uncharacterized flavoprotein (TIGR03862 family)
LNGPSVAVIGGGPTGLRAAEVIARHGIHTTIFEQKASPGRKFLVAGRGGLNITHSESLDKFVSRYDAPERWADLLERFSPRDLIEWFEGLGVETFVGTSGRVFPRNIRTPMILELWLERLDRLGCDFQVGRRFHQMLGSGPYDLVFQRGAQYQLFTADSVLFALGGASWPQTGSDALWVEEFRRLGVEVRGFTAANVGWERAWSERFLRMAEGKPLKNLEVSCSGRTAAGELMVTEYGLEGGAIYQLTRELRDSPEITIDFKPELSHRELERRLQSRAPQDLKEGAIRFWRLSVAAAALVEEVADPKTLNDWITATKACHVRLEKPRPIEEAISCAGGVPWNELDENLMLHKLPGAFCAGEMIDWEAPTGGYLLQGCFVTATIAGEGVAKWIAKGHQP